MFWGHALVPSVHLTLNSPQIFTDLNVGSAVPDHTTGCAFGLMSVVLRHGLCSSQMGAECIPDYLVQRAQQLEGWSYLGSYQTSPNIRLGHPLTITHIHTGSS